MKSPRKGKFFQKHTEKTPPDNTTTNIIPPAPLPTIHIETLTLGPLAELVKEITQNHFTIKQMKDSEFKVQVNSSETYRKLILA
ncbi:hypothetical protein M0802_014646 [Mischocyttarus mexicanus]|nr:hypothetical protein M0802_014646 [Mischocyttarus mexicanus]